jgi:transcriptional regulator with XRE-family HTH domain
MIAVTRFEEFLLARHIRYAELARASGYSRQHILKLRKGTNHPTRRCIAALVRACRRLTKEKVQVSDLFDERRFRIGRQRVIACCLPRPSDETK